MQSSLGSRQTFPTPVVLHFEVSPLSFMNNVFIAGTGDLAREVLYAIREQNDAGGHPFTVRGFLDPAASGKQSLEALPVLSIADLDGTAAEKMQCIIGIGKTEYVRKAESMLRAKGVREWVNVIHPRAYLAPQVELGKGVYIAAHATIAIAARIQDFSCVNQNVSIGHDAVIGPFSIVNPGCIISGRCHLEESVYLGSGAVLFPGVKVGADSLISANCVVTKNVPARVKVMPVGRNMEIPRDA
jgi:sugar O-acyltransferase (sialic acid O-acetyltransferase NeuD family)